MQSQASRMCPHDTTEWIPATNQQCALVICHFISVIFYIYFTKLFFGVCFIPSKLDEAAHIRTTELVQIF